MIDKYNSIATSQYKKSNIDLFKYFSENLK